MYVATMEYPLLPAASPSEAAALWKSVVAQAAQGREGLVRMQLFSRPGALLAIGTWRDKAFAEAFMQTGVFKTLMERLTPLLATEPLPRLWDEQVFLSP